jgi:hypothetical protein
MNEVEHFFRSLETSGKNITWSKAAIPFGISGNALRKQYNRWKNKERKKSTASCSHEGTWICIFDAHVPFHNKRMLESVVRLCSDIKPVGLLLGGDFLDLASISSHDKGKFATANLTLGKEYAEGNRVLDIIEGAYRFKKKVYIQGNHEQRFKRYMKDIDNIKINDAVKSPEEALRLTERGFKVFDNYPFDAFFLGDLCVYHGETTSIHCAYGDMNKFFCSVMFGHVHRQSMHTNQKHEAYSIGSMADHDSLGFVYAGRKVKEAWSNGLAIVTVIEGKSYVETVRFKNNKLVFGAKLY